MIRPPGPLSHLLAQEIQLSPHAHPVVQCLQHSRSGTNVFGSAASRCAAAFSSFAAVFPARRPDAGSGFPDTSDHSAHAAAASCAATSLSRPGRASFSTFSRRFASASSAATTRARVASGTLACRTSCAAHSQSAASTQRNASPA